MKILQLLSELSEIPGHELRLFGCRPSILATTKSQIKVKTEAVGLAGIPLLLCIVDDTI